MGGCSSRQTVARKRSGRVLPSEPTASFSGALPVGSKLASHASDKLFVELEAGGDISTHPSHPQPPDIQDIATNRDDGVRRDPHPRTVVILSSINGESLQSHDTPSSLSGRATLAPNARRDDDVRSPNSMPLSSMSFLSYGAISSRSGQVNIGDSSNDLVEPLPYVNSTSSLNGDVTQAAALPNTWSETSMMLSAQVHQTARSEASKPSPSTLSETTSTAMTVGAATTVTACDAEAVPSGCVHTSVEKKTKTEVCGSRVKQVNQYVLGEVVGRGAYGKVRRCVNQDTGVACAVKYVRKSTLRRKRVGRFGNALTSVQREVSVWGRLRHPHIVPLYEVIDDPSSDKMYMVCELMEGGSVLPDTGNSPPLPLDVARRYTRQLISAVLYCHSQGVAHRDIKPGNVMLDGSHTCAKLGDFGNAHEFTLNVTPGGDADDSVRATVGTPAFLAPEMLSGEAFSTRLQDTWAVGMTLYNMVVGQPAWAAPTVPELYELIKTAPIPWPTHGGVTTDEACRSLIEGLLAKSPRDRTSLSAAERDAWLVSPPLLLPRKIAGRVVTSAPYSGSTPSRTPSPIFSPTSIQLANSPCVTPALSSVSPATVGRLPPFSPSSTGHTRAFGTAVGRLEGFSDTPVSSSSGTGAGATSGGGGGGPDRPPLLNAGTHRRALDQSQAFARGRGSSTGGSFHVKLRARGADHASMYLSSASDFDLVASAAGSGRRPSVMSDGDESSFLEGLRIPDRSPRDSVMSGISATGTSLRIISPSESPPTASRTMDDGTTVSVGDLLSMVTMSPKPC